jgi:hypothetical protein
LQQQQNNFLIQQQDQENEPYKPASVKKKTKQNKPNRPKQSANSRSANSDNKNINFANLAGCSTNSGLSSSGKTSAKHNYKANNDNNDELNNNSGDEYEQRPLTRTNLAEQGHKSNNSNIDDVFLNAETIEEVGWMLKRKNGFGLFKLVLNLSWKRIFVEL